MLACPTPLELQSPDGNGVVVEFEMPQVMGGEPPVDVTCAPESGSSFPVGTTPVECTATDSRQRVESCSFDVVVVVPPMLGVTRFLAFGDSFTFGQVSSPTARFQLLATPASYPTQLEMLLSQRYPTQTFTIINSGVSGEQAQDGKLRFRGALDGSGAQAVLLLEGVNDLNRLGEAGLSIAAGSVEDMVQDARARGAEVFLGTLPPQRPEQRLLVDPC